MNLFKNIVLLMSVLLLIGCAPESLGLDKSKPHATIIPIFDKNHIHGNSMSDFSSIFITHVNGQETDMAFRGTKRNIKHGKVTLTVEENRKGEIYSFTGNIAFNAELGEKYVISSEIKRAGKFIDKVEILVIHKGKVIKRAKTTKEIIPTYLYIPVII